jgi:uncharacterized protein YdeI (YjbR/CyaY-like superfamily)
MPTEPDAPARAELPILAFRNDAAWEKWLAKHHSDSPGLWIEIAKVGSGVASITYGEAVNTALCFGWIDGQKAGGDKSWVQKFTPRGKRSIWSKLNRERIAVLRKSGRMRPAGEAEVARALKDGRWEAAYDSPKTATVPADFQAALGKSKTAATAFAALNAANRYAMLWRIQTAKKPETKAKRIADFIAMLKRGEKLHP